MNDLLEKSKEYLRVTGGHDDSTIGLLVNSAKQYLKNAGVKEQESDLYTLAVLMLVTHWYENREQVTDSIPHAVSIGLQSIILQIRAGDY